MDQTQPSIHVHDIIFMLYTCRQTDVVPMNDYLLVILNFSLYPSNLSKSDRQNKYTVAFCFPYVASILFKQEHCMRYQHSSVRGYHSTQNV